MNYLIQYFSFVSGVLTKDSNGKLPGILIKHTKDMGGVQVETGSEEAYLLSDLRINYSSESGSNIFKRYIKVSAENDFTLSSFEDSGIPQFEGEPFITNSKVIVTNDYYCNSSGVNVLFTEAVEHDADGAPVLQDGEYVVNPGYFGVYDFYFNNIAKNNLITPVLNILISRLDNRDI